MVNFLKLFMLSLVNVNEKQAKKQTHFDENWLTDHSETG